MAISCKAAWNSIGNRATRQCSECGKRFQIVPESHAYRTSDKVQCSYTCWRAAGKRVCPPGKSEIRKKSNQPREKIIEEVLARTREAANYKLLGYDDLRKKVVQQRSDWLAALEEQMMREISDKGIQGGDELDHSGD